MARIFLIDKRTCKIQGNSQYKTRCGKYKRIGDGIQTDCIEDDGFTCDFYFRNEPVDEKWIHMGMSLMHARLLHMYSGLRDVSHSCKIDNLFNLVNLPHQSFALPAKVKTNGVLRKSQRGVHPSVVKEECKTKKGAEQARGTLKVAVLKGDSKSCDLVVVSNYDQKPFYMITHSIPEETWIVCGKTIHSPSLGKKVVF